MRPSPFRSFPIVLLLAASAAALQAQQLPVPAFSEVRSPAPSATPQESLPPGRACAGCPKRRVPWAIAEALLTNVLINRIDYHFHSNEEERGEGGTFDVSPETWADNLRDGWEWDANNFSTNQFAHPYHGSTYFNSGRSNGLTFWESAPLAAMGSFTWEYFGETARPSINDFVATTVGGIALGETFHRLATLVRDNSKHGWSRAWREIAALPMDPVGTFNRIIFGDFARQMPNPEERSPTALRGLLQVGAVTLSDTLSNAASIEEVQQFSRLDLMYGDDFATPFRNPYDVFRFTVQMGGGSERYGNISVLQVLGRLWGRPLNARDTWRFSLDQNYQYSQNPAYELGGQSVVGRFVHRSDIGGGWTLDASVGGVGILLGAIRAESVQVGEREYDFGPGLGFVAGAGFRRGDVTIGRFTYTNYFIGTLSGSNGRHVVQDIAADAFFPVWQGVGVGAAAHLFLRNSNYPNIDDTHQEALQLRAFGAYHF